MAVQNNGGEIDLSKLRRELIDRIKRKENDLESEIIWVLFCSALRSYKKEFLLKPFPPMFTDQNGDKNFEELTAVCERIPPFRNMDILKLGDEQVRLIHWVLHHSEFKITRVTSTEDRNEVNELMRNGLKAGQDGIKLPRYVFKFNPSSSAANRFQTVSEGKEIKFAFHGSRLDNFYSILHHGLISNLNKTSAFGEGTYLSEDFGVCLNWSPLAGPGFLPSYLGDRFGCVALCQLALDDTGGIRHSEQAKTSSAPPEKYIIVKNDSLVQLKYLLVYCEIAAPRVRQENGILVNFIRTNWLWVLLIGYVGLLLIAGLANNRNIHFYVRRLTDYLSASSSSSEDGQPSTAHHHFHHNDEI